MTPAARIALVVLLALPAGAHAATSGASDAARDAAAGARTPRWITLGLLSGASQSDRRLADYQWDVGARGAWGAQVVAGAGRFGAGLRAWTTSTTQHIDLGGAPDPRVRATSLDAVGRARLVSRWGGSLEALASVGRMRIGYSPDHVSVPTGGAPAEVALRPVDSWAVGGGLALRRRVAESWETGIELDTRAFGMDTAHQSGGGTVLRHERFRDWNARIELARILGRR